MVNGNGNGNGEYLTTENGKPIEWWKSKKFTGYMVGDFTWKATIFVCLYIIATVNDGLMSGSWLTFMFAVVVTAGVAQMGFLGGQAWIDRYTKAIQIPAALGSAMVGKMADALDGDEEKKELPAPPPESSDEEEAEDEEDLVDPEKEPKDD